MIKVNITEKELLKINLTQEGEVNSGVNVGDGAEVYKEKENTHLKFRTLKAGKDIVITQEDDEIEIKADIQSAVTSVNSKTGVVVLDADDISDATTNNKFTNQTDINRLANTSGSNTGDQSSSDFDHNSLQNTHNLTTDIDHNQTTNYDVNEHRKINDSGTATTDLLSASKINTELGKKVDKVAGKELSSNDLTNDLKSNYDNAYTHSTLTTGNPHSVTKTDVGLNNVDDVQQAPLAHVGTGGNQHLDATTIASGFMSSTDKSKLDGVANNANNYSHPDNHPPSIITQDENNRFVTDTEKSTWNSKQSALGFTPEDVANKKTSITDSDTDYPTTKAVKTALSAKQDSLGYTAENTANKGQNNGYASLDGGGKIPAAQLPSTVMEFKGVWNATTNDPHLENGQEGDIKGDVYLCNVAGTVDFGAGDLTFKEGDWVVYNGSIWQKSINSNAVVSVNGQTGVVSITSSDFDHNQLQNTHNLTTDIDHNSITNTHNLTTDIDHNQLTNYQLNQHRVIDDESNLTTDLFSANKITTELNKKVDKVAGKELSTNDFTDTLKNKLDVIQEGAEVNVNADWNATSGDAQILNKPTDIIDLSTHSVTELNDVTSPGSGKIITDDERTNLNNQSGTNTGDQSSSDFDIKDLTDSTNLKTTWNSKENGLGNPDTDDFVLSSKTDGTRRWVEMSSNLEKATGAEINTGTNDGKFVTPKAITDSILYNLPEGTLYNGKIVPSVTSNNLTVALKTMAGNDPSATDPIYIRINSVLRKVTSALSVTKNSGTNWCNAGSAELATKEIDYFVYLGYNATDGVAIGFSRIPYGALYSDFSATTTNEKYCAISTITNAVAGDNYVNIGRFAATLSAGAGYTWSVPTFTSVNLIQRPIYETRILKYEPTMSYSESMTIDEWIDKIIFYRISGKTLFLNVAGILKLKAPLSYSVYASLPFSADTSFVTEGTNSNVTVAYGSGETYNGRSIFPSIMNSTPTVAKVRWDKKDINGVYYAYYPSEANVHWRITITYQI
jgi:hypothetical protein